MKRLLTILSLIIVHPIFAQTEEAPALAFRLTNNLAGEKAKVTAIFNWITSNISYRVKPDRRKVIGSHSMKNYQDAIREEVDDGSPLKPLNERVAENVLQKRWAVCDGYARLFTTLCDYAGVRSEVIVGYARAGNNKPHQGFGVNHYWNAVRIDSTWHLLDATWASGYLSPKGDVFVRDFDEKYFLPDPEQFIQDHYPDDVRWTLLPDNRIPEEFRRTPFRHKSFAKYRITSYYPARGIIDAYVGDTVRLELVTALSELERQVCPDLLIDSALFTHSPTWVFLKPEATHLKNKHQYVYTIDSPGVEWLYLLYNDDLVLRYKVNIKKKKT